MFTYSVQSLDAGHVCPHHNFPPSSPESLSLLAQPHFLSLECSPLKYLQKGGVLLMTVEDQMEKEQENC